jgi:hypothetical protein
LTGESGEPISQVRSRLAASRWRSAGGRQA